MSLVYRAGRLVEKGGPEDIRPPDRRSDLPTPMIVRDGIAPTVSQLDGRTYESRGDLYRSYKNGRVRVIERGEKPLHSRGSKVSKDDVRAAVQKVKNGYRPQIDRERVGARPAFQWEDPV